jgi:hypothetical protein
VPREKKMATASYLHEGLLAFPPTSRSLFTGAKAFAARLLMKNKIHIYVVNTRGKSNGLSFN